MRNVDLNCDLGEGEPPARTRALMRWITSANVACGGHAGDARSMRRCVQLAREFDVSLGAHPGGWNRTDMGRSAVRLSAEQLELLLLHQVGGLEKIASAEGVGLHHIKLHGALYHAVEADDRLARAFLRCVRRHWPEVKIYALAGGRVGRLARRLGVRCLAEGFADRAYLADGQLVPRTRPGAVLDSVARAVERVREGMAGRGLRAVDGRRLRLSIDTWCVHADSPNSLAMVKALAGVMADCGE